jgi:hypothetical protein
VDKDLFYKWLEGQTIELEAERDHALKFDNYGKAAEMNGQLISTRNVLSQIELGDFVNHKPRGKMYE